MPAQAADIRPLINQLQFIQNKSRWGYAFRFGHIEIPQADFELIAAKMLPPESRIAARQATGYVSSQITMFN
jgi:hypothetical protein